MAIASTDIVFYASASMPEDNSTTSGGAIDTTAIVVFDSSTLANTLEDTVEILSSNAGDTTQTVTIYGRAASGSLVSEPLSLNGVTVVNGATTFERIMKIVVSASHAGTITIRKASDNTTIATLATGILSIRRLFYGAAADASGGSSRDFYEKVFAKNIHGTLSLLSAQVQENADPSALITFNIDNSVNASTSVASRLNTAPSSQVGSFDGSAKNVPTTDLAAGDAQGIWVKMTLPAGQAPTKSTYVIRVTGTSV